MPLLSGSGDHYQVHVVSAFIAPKSSRCLEIVPVNSTVCMHAVYGVRLWILVTEIC